MAPQKRPRRDDGRKTAAQLIQAAMPTKFGIPWFRQLTEEGRNYVHAVVQEMIAHPDAALSVVAEALIYELKINRSANTVARTLKGMIRDAQQKT